MKKIFLTMIAAATLASCSKDAADYPQAPGKEGFGSLKITTATAPYLAAETRAAGDKVYLSTLGVRSEYIPAGESLRTMISCMTDGVTLSDGKYRVANSVSEFNADGYQYPAGDYKITLGQKLDKTGKLPHYYDSAAGKKVDNVDKPYYTGSGKLIPRIPEGDRPYFEGTADVKVENDQLAEATVTVSVINTVVCIDFTDRFKGYFPNGATIDITTKTAGTVDNQNEAENVKSNTFTVSYTDASRYTKRYFWIRPQGFTISGHDLKRQNPTSAPVTFDPYSVSDSKVQPGRLYTYMIDIDGVGSTAGSGITITVNDQPVGTVLDETVDLTQD